MKTTDTRTTNFKMTTQEHAEADARIAQEMAEYSDGSYADHGSAKSAMTALYVEAFLKGQASATQNSSKLAVQFIEELDRKLDKAGFTVAQRTVVVNLLTTTKIEENKIVN